MVASSTTSLERGPASAGLPITRRLDRPGGYLIVALASFIVAVVVGSQGLAIGLAVLAAIVGVPALLFSVFHLRWGLSLAIALSFAVNGLKRVVPQIPFGTVLDGLLALLLLGLLLRQLRRRDWSVVGNAVTVMIAIWLGYSLLELLNPLAPSRVAWFYTVRAMSLMPLLYVIAAFAIDRRSAATGLLKLWIGLALIAAGYGLFQEFFGLRAFELDWLSANEREFQLIYNWGRYRTFSFLSDPSVYGILMACTALLCFILAAGPFGRVRRLLLLAGGSVMALATVYSGTRTAFVLLPVGFGFYLMLTWSRHALLTSAVLGCIGAVVLFGPIHGPNISRIRSAFDPANSPSYQVRMENQDRIRPYIRSHPIGAGLGSTGIWGERFSPDSWLAEFPPDSGYVRVAVEMGWIGLLLYCALFFAVLRLGVGAFFESHRPGTKICVAAVLSAIFAWMVANLTQEAITAIPTNLLFWTAVAVVSRLRDFDLAAQRG